MHAPPLGFVNAGTVHRIGPASASRSAWPEPDFLEMMARLRHAKAN
jgi:hypothetical protein